MTLEPFLNIFLDTPFRRQNGAGNHAAPDDILEIRAGNQNVGNFAQHFFQTVIMQHEAVFRVVQGKPFREALDCIEEQ